MGGVNQLDLAGYSIDDKIFLRCPIGPGTPSHWGYFGNWVSSFDICGCSVLISVSPSSMIRTPAAECARLLPSAQCVAIYPCPATPPSPASPAQHILHLKSHHKLCREKKGASYWESQGAFRVDAII